MKFQSLISLKLGGVLELAGIRFSRRSNLHKMQKIYLLEVYFPSYEMQFLIRKCVKLLPKTLLA